MAPETDFMAPLFGALRDVTTWWAAEDVDGIIMGGLAVAFLGRPRITRDVDGLVWLDETCWQAFLASSASFGFEPRQNDVLALAHEARVLLLRHVSSGIDVDIAFAALREALDRAQRIDVQGLGVPAPTPEDLIIMKAVAHRPRDLADVEGVLDAHPEVDRRRIRRYVRQFASVLAMPEIAADIERLLARRRAQSRRPKPRRDRKRGNK